MPSDGEISEPPTETKTGITIEPSPVAPPPPEDHAFRKGAGIAKPLGKDDGKHHTKAELEHLAFSTADKSEGLVCATSHSPFRASYDKRDVHGSATLNVECFGRPGEDKDWPALLFVHGICESAETWSVQRIAKACLERKWRLFVLELEGHGLSSGQRAVCGNFRRLEHHVWDFVKHVMLLSDEMSGIPFALSGTSLGGVLVAYGADAVSKHRDEYGCRMGHFLGAALIAPAVGVHPSAVPAKPVVGALRVLSRIAPGAGFLTPVEDPSGYACPASSTRTFKGHWPLSTSRMLLDVTSKTVTHDQREGRLVLDVPVLVVAGEEDEFVPAESSQRFFDGVKTEKKKLVKVPKADHGLLFAESSAQFVIRELFEWLEERKNEAAESEAHKT